jgi:hypothetical protein
MFKTCDIGLKKTLEFPTRTQYPQKIHTWAGIFNNIGNKGKF